MIDTRGSGLRHRRIEEDIRRKVANSIWSVGDMLPSRRDLAKQYGVSTLTVERAVDSLIREGVLRSDDRRGTFVAGLGTGPAAAPTRPQLTVGMAGTLFPKRDGAFEASDLNVQQIVRSIEEEFSGDDQGTIFTNRVPDSGPLWTLAETVQRSLRDGVDGLIVIAIGQERNEIDAATTEVERSGIPAVFVTSTELCRPIPHVVSDGADAGYQAARHLIDQGVGSLAFFGPASARWIDQRRAGTMLAGAHMGLEVPEFGRSPSTRTQPYAPHEAERTAYLAAQQALGSEVLPAGVVCANDSIALGLARAAKEAGRTLGEDLFLVGFDDGLEARNLGLTSLRAPWPAMGREAARILTNAIEHRNESLQVRLRWRLIPRASSRGNLAVASNERSLDLSTKKL